MLDSVGLTERLEYCGRELWAIVTDQLFGYTPPYVENSRLKISTVFCVVVLVV